MAEKSEASTEKKILDAAREQFHDKGFAGARMQAIADEAAINKAMLHYYYRSKEELFKAVFQRDMKAFLPEIVMILTNEDPLFEKIRTFTDHYISFFQANPSLPSFIVTELSQNPEKLVQGLIEENRIELTPFFEEVRAEGEKGNIRKIPPEHLMVNLVSMCIFPFVGKPLLQGILEMEEEQFQDFLESRKKEVADFVIDSISR
jgi:TetR/AcrR family transcriptional regulator